MGKQKDDKDGAVAEATKPPTIGRIVLYTDADGKVSPAIVTEVMSTGEVHVCAFDSVMGPRNYLTSGEGDKPGEWAWPNRD